MVNIIRGFHDGMQVKVRSNGSLSEPYIRMGEIGTVGIWSPKTRSVPEFVHWAVHCPHAPSCPGRRAKKIGSLFLKNFEIVNLVSAHLASAVRSAKKIQGACERQRRQGKKNWIFFFEKF